MRGAETLPRELVRTRMRERVRAAVRVEALRAAPGEVETLVAALRERYGERFSGALYYGSCRHRSDPEGIYDLHVLLSELRGALAPLPAALCRWLPPNVYYLEAAHEGRTVRCKYAVLSVEQFERGCSRRAFHSYFWGRYAQPVTLVGFEASESIIESLTSAVETLAWRALPRLGEVAEARAYWLGALRLSYAAELRPEGDERAATLVDAYPEYYRATGAALLEARAAVPGGTPGSHALRARIDWAARSASGKLLTVARLLKGLVTFEGGIDYLAYKLERHTGVPVVITEAARRRPLLYVWPIVWRLWRQGAFR